MDIDTTVPVLLITGPIGVGKTTIAHEISDLLEDVGMAHAFVDVDSLHWYYPCPLHDPLKVRLAMNNLAAVWANFRAVGVTRLILSDVLQSRSELTRYQEAVPGAQIIVVRLRAALPTLYRRKTYRIPRDWIEVR